MKKNFLSLSDYLKESSKEKSVNNQIKKILNFPRVAQGFTYDCGAAAFQLVLTYYGVYERETEFMKILKTVPVEKFNNGTKLSAIKKGAEFYGFECEIKRNMTDKDLIKCIDKDIPVIVLLQAWRLKEDEEWTESYNNGHYVVAIGYTKDKIIFEDPYSFTRNYLTFSELKQRWHAVNDNSKPDPISVGVIIYGYPTFDEFLITHME